MKVDPKDFDFEELGRRGSAIYKRIKDLYEPHENGKYIVIEPDTERVYIGVDVPDAVEKAKKENPDKYFFAVKIGIYTPGFLEKYVLGLHD